MKLKQRISRRTGAWLVGLLPLMLAAVLVVELLLRHIEGPDATVVKWMCVVFAVTGIVVIVDDLFFGVATKK